MSPPNVTVPTDDDVRALLEGNDDAISLAALMRAATGVAPVLWVGGMVGFGTHHYAYESGREGDTVAVGFAPRRRALALYGLFHHPRSEQAQALVRAMGRLEVGKGCLYVKALADVDVAVLAEIVTLAYRERAAGSSSGGR